MATHVVDAQKIKDLEAIVADLNAGDYTVGLYKAAITPTHATVIGDITECNFTGYARIALAGGAVAGAVDGSYRATATFTEVTFTMGTPGTTNSIYGYFVIDEGDGKLAWIQPRDDGLGFVFDTAGQTYKVTPKRTLQNNPSP